LRGSGSIYYILRVANQNSVFVYGRMVMVDLVTKSKFLILLKLGIYVICAVTTTIASGVYVYTHAPGGRIINWHHNVI